MKQFLSTYSIGEGGVVTLIGVNRPLEAVLLIANATTGTVLYSAATGGATNYLQAENSIITLSVAPSLTDKLQIFYDDGIAQINSPTAFAQNNKENPFATLEGQEVISVSENFWARLGRLGRVRSITRNSTAFASGVYGTYTVQNNAAGSASSKFPSLGHIFYPQCITVSTTVDAEVWIAIYPSTSDNTIFVEQGGFVKANTPFTWYPDASVYLTSGDGVGFDGQIIIRIAGPNSGYYRFNVTGIEIARNDV